MVETIIGIIKDNLMTTVMFVLTFIGGIGIGAGITDAIYRWTKK